MTYTPSGADHPAGRTPGAELGAAFVAVADTLDGDRRAGAGDGRAGDVLVARCVAVLEVAAAGLLLADGAADGTAEAVAASDETVRALVGKEGPGRECHRAGIPIGAGALERAAPRWPDFAAAARTAGYGAAFAVPMRWRDETIGALVLFRTESGPLPDGTAELAQALADVTTIGVLQRRARRQREQLADQLQTALESRVLVEQAKGLLAERWQVSVDAAFTALRRHARARRIRLSDLAQGLLDHTVDPSDLQDGAP
ncbi:GAF and ANTAR domain-containing protein [Actinacidiphila alni]|uniref:GAF and ANTAR domain-containing protein n=1 Tax=Actinacidiphila alni TaxID=380248 RepID=UPI003454C5A6